MKRYFPVIIKPFTLILLLFLAVSLSFVVFQVISPIRPESTVLTPDFTPAVRNELRELYGLNEPLHVRYLLYLRNMFTWQFGYSFDTLHSVAYEMIWRLPTTLLLIGLSTLFSILIGIILSVLTSVAFKSNRRRPATFAHLLQGRYFAPVLIIGLLLIFFLVFCFAALYGSPLFPSRGLYSIPPPTDPTAYIINVAWHLVLPVTALVLINAVRVPLVTWSSGSPFASKTTLKRVLLPITTTDFAFTISAIIIIEYIFTLPGIGQWFFTALMRANYPVLMALSVVLVEIAIGLGFISVLFEFIERITGMHDDLHKKANIQSGTNSSHISIQKKLFNYLSRRKDVILGLAIIITFLVFAVFAPWLTPYNPLASETVADRFAPPEWVRMFAQFKNLSTTRISAIYWEAEEEWMYEHVVEWGKDVRVDFRAETTDQVTLTFTSTYPYSQSVPPNAFYADFEWAAQGVKDLEYLLKLFLVDPNGTSTMIWIMPTNWMDEDSGQAVHVDSTDWELLARLGLQLGVDNLAHEVFRVPEGDYTFILEMSIRPKTSAAECEIRFTDTVFVTLGHVYGILGSDNNGFDIWTQLVYGARTMALYVFLAAFLAAIWGFPFGFLSGYFEGWTDNIIMPLIDTLLFMPILPAFLIFATLFGKSWIILALISPLFFSALAAKAFRNMFLVRPSNQKLKGKTTAEQVLNIFKDLLSNFSLIAISFLFLFPTIDFLGFGDPRVPSWGKMLHQAFGFGGFSYLAWWWIVPPIICIVVLALGFLLLGAGLEDT